MNDVIIPLALEDHIIMDTLLGLSGSHMLKQNNTKIDPLLEAEQHRLHKQALQLQSRRTQHLLAADSTTSFKSESDRERIFANWLLLCLYEITEGTSDIESQKHLDMALQVITRNYDAGGGSQMVGTHIHPFLIEYFLYHICLALVTMPSFLDSQASISNLTTLLSREKSMVGIIEMLLDFIKRLAILRLEANREGPHSSTVLLDSITIHQDLENLEIPLDLSPDQLILAEFYQKALSIWLFSIVNPDEKSNPQIQRLVQEVTTKMSGISDSVKACLLFPLFMVGGAAISQEDKDVVTVLFRELRSWSSLGNIDVTFGVVKNMWKDYDDGIANAWDWTTQLEEKSMRVLIT